MNLQVLQGIQQPVFTPKPEPSGGAGEPDKISRDMLKIYIGHPNDEKVTLDTPNSSILLRHVTCWAFGEEAKHNTVTLKAQISERVRTPQLQPK